MLGEGAQTLKAPKMVPTARLHLPMLPLPSLSVSSNSSYTVTEVGAILLPSTPSGAFSFARMWGETGCKIASTATSLHYESEVKKLLV